MEILNIISAVAIVVCTAMSVLLFLIDRQRSRVFNLIIISEAEKDDLREILEAKEDL